MSEVENSAAVVVDCPADGCDYRGLCPSVAGHYSGTHDDKHDGGYARAKLLVDMEMGREVV